MRDRATAWMGGSLGVMLLGVIVSPAMAATRVAELSVPLPATVADSHTFADEALERIVEAVQKRYNARVVKVTEVMVDGKRAYELRLLSDQRVWTVRVDAETGQELSRND
jgi:hypothetical protein